MYFPDDILAHTERLSMRHSLELRVQFTDQKLAPERFEGFCPRTSTP